MWAEQRCKRAGTGKEVGLFRKWTCRSLGVVALGFAIGFGVKGWQDFHEPPVAAVVEVKPQPEAPVGLPPSAEQSLLSPEAETLLIDGAVFLGSTAALALAIRYRRPRS